MNSVRNQVCHNLVNRTSVSIYNQVGRKIRKGMSDDRYDQMVIDIREEVKKGIN